MTLSFTEMPLGTNNLYAHVGKRRFMIPKARANKEALAWQALSQMGGKPPMTGSLSVSATLYWPDRRKHDIDNIKILLDALTGIVWEDDGQIVDLELHKRFDKERPRVEMTVHYA